MGTLPVDNRDEVKRTNEIKTAIPLLEAIDITGKDVTADALLTQPRFAQAATLLEDGQVLVAGGFDGAGSAPTSAEMSELSTGTWQTTASIERRPCGYAGGPATKRPSSGSGR